MPTLDRVLDAIEKVESGGNPYAVSPAGAQGAYQFMPATAKEYGLSNPFDRKASRAAAERKMQDLLREYDGDLTSAVAAYNLGQGNMRKVGGNWQRVPETNQYVHKVAAASMAKQPKQDDGWEDVTHEYMARPSEPDNDGWEDVTHEYHGMPQAGDVVETPKTPAYDPTEGMSTGERFAAGAGKAVVDTGRGLGQIARKVLPDSVSDSIGLPTQQDIDEVKKRDEALMNTPAGIFGNVAGNVATGLAAGPVVGMAGKAAGMAGLAKTGKALSDTRSAANAAAIGATVAGTQPVASDESRIGNIATGTLGGYFGNKAVGAASRVLSPKLSPEVQKMIDEGVELTPGQRLGGAWQRTENKATSLPIAGDSIISAQQRAHESFNRATINKALADVGDSLPEGKVGYDAIKYADKAVSRRYEEILPNISIKLDKTIDKQLSTLRYMSQSGDLSEVQAREFENILKHKVFKKFTPEGNMMGQTFKGMDADLGSLARGLRGSNDYDKRQLADALRETQAILRRAVERQNPEYRGELKKINSAFAKLVRIEGAASQVGAKEGIFTPAQLLSNTKRFDSSVRKKASAKGEALMQDWAETGSKVLGSYPDSGTAGRLLMNGATLGGGLMYSPESLMGLGGVAAAYTKPGITLADMFLTRRPDAVRKAGKALRKAAPAAGILGAAFGASANDYAE